MSLKLSSRPGVEAVSAEMPIATTKTVTAARAAIRVRRRAGETRAGGGMGNIHAGASMVGSDRIAARTS